jgi:hypothetical protein
MCAVLTGASVHCYLHTRTRHSFVHTYIGSEEIHVNYYYANSINPAMADEFVIITEFHKVTFLNLEVTLRKNCTLLGYYAASSGHFEVHESVHRDIIMNTTRCSYID